jgi:plasmid stabilization system protein ParE
MYEICYLRLAQKDLNDIIGYIAGELKAPQAASDFIDAVEAGIERLREYPYSCRVYQPLLPVDLEYRVLTVKNYLIFYVVLDDIVEIHRVVFGRRDLRQVIK